MIIMFITTTFVKLIAAYNYHCTENVKIYKAKRLSFLNFNYAFHSRSNSAIACFSLSSSSNSKSFSPCCPIHLLSTAPPSFSMSSSTSSSLSSSLLVQVVEEEVDEAVEEDVENLIEKTWRWS